MVRTAYAETKHQNYLNAFATSNNCTVGVIIGQHFEGNDYILHLAQTPRSLEKKMKGTLNIKDLLEVPIAEHAKHTTRMLSGGLYVLGVFIVSEERVMNPMSPKVKSILTHLHNRLEKNPLMYGNCTTAHEKIVLHCSKSGCTAGSYNVHTFEEDTVNFVFNEKEHIWLPIQCRFEIDEMIPIFSGDPELSLKKYIKEILFGIDNSLKSAVYLYNGHIKKASLLLNSIPTGKIKGFLGSATVFSEDPEKDIIHVDLLLKSTGSILFESTNVYDSFGCLRVYGIIACNIWVNPNVSYSAVSSAINEDIIRSLSSRLGMHFDSLTEGERGFFKESCCVHEVPRRVLLPLPNSTVTFSDYLFPGEGPQDAEAFQDVLDIQTIDKDLIVDAEGQADLEYYKNRTEKDNEVELPELPADTNKLMYMVGALVGILILIISMLIQYFKI